MKVMRTVLVWLLFSLLHLTGSLGWTQEYSLYQYLNIQSAGAPTFNPAGTEVLYRTNISGVNQFWRMPAFGGYQQQLTFDTNGVAGAWWSPRDQKLIVVAAATGGNERTQLYIIHPNGGMWNDISGDATAIFRFGCWSRDGSRFAYATNKRNKVDFDIYEYNIDGKSTTLLYQGTGDNSASAYSYDNRYLLIENTYSSYKSDLLLYDGESNRTRNLTQFEGEAVHSGPEWSPGGYGFFLRTNRDREFTGLAFWPLDGAALRWIETPNWDVEHFALSVDSSFLVWSVNEGGTSKFHLRKLETGIDLGSFRFPDGVIHGFKFSNDGALLAVTYSSDSKPSDIWIYDPRGDRLKQLTYSATGGIPPQTFRTAQLIEYPTFDERKIPAYFFTPAEVKGKMPVIVLAHGGPESQSRPTLNGLVQYFLSRGYAMLVPNIRGSSGYGREYLALDNARKRMDSIQDIEYAAIWLAARSDVDSTRMVIYGGSYGGFVVLSSITTYPERWAAGVSVVGISNFVTFLTNTGGYRRALREAEYGSLAADSAFLVEVSPTTHIDNIRSPLMLIQGANDPRVPQSESDQMAEALRTKGGVVEYLLFGDEGHGLAKLKNRLTAYAAMDQFLTDHVLKRKGP